MVNVLHRRVLITGGTGSLGSRLVEEFDKFQKVRILSRDEWKQSELKKKFPHIECVLGDVRNYETCLRATRDCDEVIHTAALKRIEFGEHFPEEFIKTNLMGTINMVKASMTNNVKRFVFVSSDKACKPINVYGMTKALAEKIVTNAGYNCVRYGNVNNSRGSVLPYWKKLSQEKKPLPITNPEMTRFLISFDKAIDIIFEALREMNGVIYVPKLNAGNISDLARLFSKETTSIGERDCEKLHEELISSEDFRLGKVKEHDDWFVISKYSGILSCRRKNYESKNHLIRGKKLKEEIKEVIE